MDGLLGFTAGVMIAASFWSLLAPAIEIASADPVPAWIPAAVGFVGGAILLRGVDSILPHVHRRLESEETEGLTAAWRRTTLLVLAITLHNIPEGLAVGVAFGAVGHQIEGITLAEPVALAIGIGIQNFPEGIAVSMPLRREGVSAPKSFWYGQLSAAVEPVAAVLGAWAVLMIEPLLPYALASAAGAMIFVVAEDVIPESHRRGHRDTATMGVIVGFTIMMILDVSLG